MSCTDANPHGTVTNFESTRAMAAKRGNHIKLRDRFGNYSIALRLCDRSVCLIFECGDGNTCVVISDPAFERHRCAGGRIEQALLQIAWIESGLAQ